MSDLPFGLPRAGARLRQILQEIRASYWFVPALMVGGAVLAATALHFASEWLIEAEVELPATMRGLGIEGGRTLIAAVATSVIGVTGVMFSLTLVAVTHAAGQYGPRLIGNFMRDRGSQWSLGTLISIFVFAMINLWLLDGGEDTEVPDLVILATFATIFPAVGAMIYFIHHVPETINVANITAGLGRRFAAMIREEIDHQHDAEERDEGEGGARERPEGEPDATLAMEGTGYVQAVAFSELEDWAEEHDADLRLEAMPGDFVHPRRPVLSVWGAHPSEDDAARLRRALALGPQPTETQTITFVADQLVEMTALALSPGINDPFTAINCLNWLAAGLAEALEHRDGLRAIDRGRVDRRALDFARLYERTFPAAMPYVEDDAMAAAAATRLLDDLAERVEARDRRAVLRDLRRARRAARAE